jgi:hypothetical protein
MSKGWTKGFGIEDKNVEERKNEYIYICVYVCAHTRYHKLKTRRKGKKPSDELTVPSVQVSEHLVHYAEVGINLTPSNDATVPILDASDEPDDATVPIAEKKQRS